MLSPNPLNRPTVTEILEHPWMRVREVFFTDNQIQFSVNNLNLLGIFPSCNPFININMLY